MSYVDPVLKRQDRHKRAEKKRCCADCLSSSQADFVRHPSFFFSTHRLVGLCAICTRLQYRHVVFVVTETDRLMGKMESCTANTRLVGHEENLEELL